MGRFRIQLLLSDITWSTRNIPESDQYSDSTMDWLLVSLSFTVEKNGIKLIHNVIEIALADMCFSNKINPLSV